MRALTPWPAVGFVSCQPHDPKRHLGEAGPQMRCLGEEERKTKTKDASFRKRLGLRSRSQRMLGTGGDAAGAVMEINSCVAGRAEGARAPQESVSVGGSGLPPWPLLLRTRSEAPGTCSSRRHAWGTPGTGCGKMMKGECYQKSHQTPM